MPKFEKKPAKVIRQEDKQLMSQYKKMLKDYKKLAQRADKRLVRIEGYRHQKGYEGIDKYAYRVAMRDISSWSKTEVKEYGRFDRVAPEEYYKSGEFNVRKSMEQLQKKIADINKFLNSATSTKKGVEETYKKRAETLNKNQLIWGDKQGTLTWEDYLQMFQTIDSKGLDALYDSRVTMLTLSVFKGINEGEINSAKDLIKYEKNMDTVQSDVLENLKQNGLTLNDLYKMVKK